MNKFLSDILNLSHPTLETADAMFRREVNGVTLYQAMRLGKAIQKLHNASADLNKLAYEISEQPLEK